MTPQPMSTAFENDRQDAAGIVPLSALELEEKSKVRVGLGHPILRFLSSPNPSGRTGADHHWCVRPESLHLSPNGGESPDVLPTVRRLGKFLTGFLRCGPSFCRIRD